MIIGILIIFLHKLCNRKLFNSSHTIQKCHFISSPFWKHPSFSSGCSRMCLQPSLRKGLLAALAPHQLGSVFWKHWSSYLESDVFQKQIPSMWMLFPCPHGWQWHQLHPGKPQVTLTGVFYLRGLLPPCLSTSLDQMCCGLKSPVPRKGLRMEIPISWFWPWCLLEQLFQGRCFKSVTLSFIYDTEEPEYGLWGMKCLGSLILDLLLT